MQQLRLTIKGGKKLSLNKYEFYAYLKAKREDESIGHFGFVIYFNKIKQLNLVFEGIKALLFLIFFGKRNTRSYSKKSIRK
jgi:hypothetical protein